jgi:hypothetical protein
MRWYICFGLALLLLAAGTAVFLILRSHGRNKVQYLGAGVFLAAVVICFPVMLKEEDAGLALLMSISHSIRMFVVDTGVIDITCELPAGTMGDLWMPYKMLVCALYLLAPVFTLTMVLQYFSNSFERFRLRMKRGRRLLVFSELNAHSIEIAAHIRAHMKESGEKSELVFCGSDKRDSVNIGLEERARKLNAILLPEEVTHLWLSSTRRTVMYFMISEKEDENVEFTLQMIESMTKRKDAKRKQKNVEIYCYATNAEAEILLDAKEKQELRVVLVDEARDAVYEQLYRYPLYTNLKPGEKKEEKERLAVLIAGGGETAIEFLKAAVWCGQMVSYQTEIHLVDIHGNSIRETLEEECPELFSKESGYEIHIYQGEVFSSETRRYLDTLKPVHYCVVALEDDEETIRSAMWLRRYFYLASFKDQPFICAHIKSKRKREVLKNLCENSRNNTKLYYDIVPFGQGSMYYGSASNAAFMLEYLGLGVQAHYFRLTEASDAKERKAAFQNFYEKQGNRRSSIANGMHISSKLWEMGYGILRVPKEKEALAWYKECIRPIDYCEESKEMRVKCYELEHERWMAYIRTEGWRLSTRGDASLRDIRECYRDYCADFKNQNYLMKLHPALVPSESENPKTATLREVEEMITEVNNEQGTGTYFPGYVQSDMELIDHIGEIVEGAWCGAEGVSIFGVRAGKGECVICRKEDLKRYLGGKPLDENWQNQ